MGTRLLSEQLIKNRYPQLRYVRIHTPAKNSVTIYAWNEELELPESEAASLSRFAAGYLLQHICYKVKAYNMIETDGVPRVEELPESIVQAALDRGLNQHGIIDVMNRMFTNGSISFEGYDMETGTIHYAVRSAAPVTDIERELIRQYLYEITPLGARSEVSYG